ALRSATGFIRREITSRIRLRVSPELHFVFDDSIERGIRMTRLIDEAMGKTAGNKPEGLDDHE
ncbi:MAG TPA: ribosome-binding factor A, partial [Clostridiales bacterium]|nr:ribosome-binding factor A [Clostridiales bacterium]